MSITNRRIADGGEDKADFYPTPAWATEVLMAHETFQGSIWEPCCGNGAMSEVIAKWMPRNETLISTDLHDRGYGQSGVDFLTSPIKADNIITNPPFNLAEEMIHRALNQTSEKVAFLLRLAFLESAGRYNRLFLKTPPIRVWVFSERITFYPEGKKTGGSGTTAYAWFVWDKRASIFNRQTELRWFPPGFKK